jgi:hypothetical protein
MSSIRQQITASMVVYLNAAGKPVGVPSAKIRRPVPDGPITSPEINVYFAAEAVEVKGGKYGPLVQRKVRVVVEARAVTTDPTKVDEILDPMLVWISKALTNSDNLGRLATDLVEMDTTWVPFYMEKIYSVARTSFLIEYQTNRKNPEAVS